MVFKRIGRILCLGAALCLALSGCSDNLVVSSLSSGNPEYENQKIIFEGEIEGSREVTVSDMRKLPQKRLQASFQRTTGLMEEFSAAGPSLADVMGSVGLDINSFKGIGVQGRDGYYCMITPETIQNQDLIMALAVDGEIEMPEDLRPARLCIKGEFGPYWVRMVDKIILYKEIPRKEIESVWVFDNLTAGIEPYYYEYYGSKDAAIEVAQVLARFDNVNNKAFFTLKSSDGFTKNESINMVSKNYYIKVAGDDAPMNIAPNIKLGMNVKKIAWFSTNADAAVFPAEMIELIGSKDINGQKGIILKDMLQEVQLRNVNEKQFELLDVSGERIRVNGREMSSGLLLIKDDGTFPVIWQDGQSHKNLSNLLCVRYLK